MKYKYNTMFKQSFKFYKAKIPEPDFDDVLDFDNFDESKNKSTTEVIKITLSNPEEIISPKGIIEISSWQCYRIKNQPGLIFLKNPFTKFGQRYWMVRCLQDYPNAPNQVNLCPKIFTSKQIENWWKALQDEPKSNIDEQKKLKNSMRWTTLGYHHDWNSKVYSEKMKNEFPDDLALLTAFFAKVLGFEKYSAEAAIVNYYPIGTTLAGHTDHSEINLEAPLFSFSFGQMAVFLIGGKTIDEKPNALFVKSGDIIIMSKESRLCYHAVPRVMKTIHEPWNSQHKGDTIQNEKKSSETNLKNNLLPICTNELYNCDGPPTSKKLKCSLNVNQQITNLKIGINDVLYEKCMNDNFWHSFNEYIKDSRININVRQVLKEGQISL